MEKFWMVKGGIGSPVTKFHDLDTARHRAAMISGESGEPAYVLEAIIKFTTVKPAEVIIEEVRL